MILHHVEFLRFTYPLDLSVPLSSSKSSMAVCKHLYYWLHFWNWHFTNLEIDAIYLTLCEFSLNIIEIMDQWCIFGHANFLNVLKDTVLLKNIMLYFIYTVLAHSY